MCRAAAPGALLLALLFLAGQFGGLVHLVAVRHARCAEHGELVELRDGGAGETARAPLTAISAGEIGHQHDHCGAAEQPRTGVTAPLVITSFATLDLPVAPPPVLAFPARVPLLRLAPKTSPPARA